MTQRNDKIGAYYKNKPLKIEVSTMEDFKKIGSYPDVPLIVSVLNDINEEKYEFGYEIEAIEYLIDRYEKLLNKTSKLAVEKRNEIKERIVILYNKINKVDPDLNDINKFKEEINNLKSTIMYKSDTKPIDLSGKTTDLFIKGRGHTISGITVEKQKDSNNTALFTNVGCDLLVHDLNISNLKVNGHDNVAALATGTGKEKNSPIIQIFNVNLDATVNGLDNVAEVLTSFDNASLECRNFAYNVKVNGTIKTGDVSNRYKLKTKINSFFDSEDYSKDSNVTQIYTRTHKKND